jgi:hypothetical protein
MRIVRLLPFALAITFAILGVAAVTAACRGSNDFDGFHRAAVHLWQTGTFSDARDIERYPPTFPLLLLPLAWLPVGWAAALWFAINAASLIGVARIFERGFGIAYRAQLPAWLLAAPFVPGNLQLGQSAPLLLFGSAWALDRARRSDSGSVLAGCVLALLGALKVLPIAFFALPAYLRRLPRSAAGLLLGACFCGAGMLLVAGVAETRDELVDWRADLRTQSPWMLVETERSLRYANQGLGVVLARSLGDFDSQRTTGRVRVMRWPLPGVWTLYGSVLAGVAMLGSRILLVARRDGGAEAWLQGFAAVALGMLCISPIVWTHYFLWLLPAGIALRRYERGLYVVAAIGLLACAFPAARALGFHLWLSLGLLVAIARTEAPR